MARDAWGDFQTPPELAAAVLRTLPDRGWTRVLEPTCGRGSFLDAAGRLGAVERIGVEVQPAHAVEAARTGAQVLHADLFDLRLDRDLPWTTGGPLLVVGNPPWVTNAELGALGSVNGPSKANVWGLRGIDALTGASNYDIAEAIWLKLVHEVGPAEPTIALLCKTHVARRVLAFCHRARIALSEVSMRRFDAKRWFGASVKSCLFTVTVGGPADDTVRVYPSLEAVEPESVLGLAEGRLVADMAAYRRSGWADGASPVAWRQGVKHDAVGVMELDGVPPERLSTRHGTAVDVEAAWVHPMLKATDLHRERLVPRRSVIVTQRTLGADTSLLAREAPRLWAHLQAHGDVLDRRKSSIYRGRPRFSMFGVGDYTFAPWKVAVSGLHWPAAFRLIGPHAGRPVVLDDTCYLLPFDEGRRAAVTAALLRSPPATELLAALAFPDAKRPVTKRVLQRLDLRALASRVDPVGLAEEASAMLGTALSVSTVEEDLAGLAGVAPEDRIA